jgi:magnesium transporter
MRRRHVKRFHPPGTSPGTLAPPPPGAGPAAFTLLTYDADEVTELRPRSLAGLAATLAGDRRHWLRIVGHGAEILQQLSTEFEVHPLVVEDIVNVGQRPKVEDYDRYLFIVVDVLRYNGSAILEEEQVTLLLFENLLVTVEERPSELFRLVEERLRQRKGKMCRMPVDYLAYALVDAAVDHYFPQLEMIGERIEALEGAVLDHAGRQSLGDLHRLKRDLIRLRKTTWPLREMVGALARTDSELVREQTVVWLRDVYDHTVQIIDVVETMRETSGQLVDLYMSSVSNRMNEVMKVLTVIATVFIPLTFIVGVYGMNFDTAAGPLSMPELAWAWGYPAVWLVMIGVAVAMVAMFRRRGWF